MDKIGKEILNDYVDACELVKETEEDIRRLRKKKRTIVQGSVKGSMMDFPYAEQHFHVEGTPYTYSDDKRLRMDEQILTVRRANAEDIKIQVEQFMNIIPTRMQRIIRFKIFQKLSWDEVAMKMGRGATADSVKKEFQRFLNEK